MKTTLQVVTDKQLRKFNIELLSTIGPGKCGTFRFSSIAGYNKIISGGNYIYDPIEIKVDDQLYNFCYEWFNSSHKVGYTRDIIIHHKKLIGCYMYDLLDSTGANIIKLGFERIILI